MKAIWNGAVIAESQNTIILEGNHYFPPSAIRSEYFKPSDTRTVCGWKGTACYYDIEVEGSTNRDAAWYYPTASETASNIQNYVAFWRGVTIEEG